MRTFNWQSQRNALSFIRPLSLYSTEYFQILIRNSKKRPCRICGTIHGRNQRKHRQIKSDFLKIFAREINLLTTLPLRTDHLPLLTHQWDHIELPLAHSILRRGFKHRKEETQFDWGRENMGNSTRRDRGRNLRNWLMDWPKGSFSLSQHALGIFVCSIEVSLEEEGIGT